MTNNNHKITKTYLFEASDVRRCCIKNDFYTCGTAREYEAMLELVSREGYSEETLFEVACDIYEHSKNQTVTNIMFVLYSEAVRTFFEVDGDDEFCL